MDQANVAGIDYGIKPVVIITGNLDYLELLSDGFKALSYGLDEFDGKPLPSIAFAFSNENTAIKCFGIFNNWKSEDPADLGVDIAFIDMGTTEYAICISPNFDALRKRALPPYLSEFVHGITTGAGFIKGFPIQHGGYEWFKSQADGRSVTVVPATIRGGPLQVLRFRKRNIPFYDEKALPSGSLVEALMTGYRRKPKPQSEERPPKQSIDALSRHRQFVMRSFFPFALEHIRLNKSMRIRTGELSDLGYTTWQIEQAACNLYVRHQYPDLVEAVNESEDEHNPHMRIVDYFASRSENVLTPISQLLPLRLDDVREQIEADARVLLTYRGIEHARVRPSGLQALMAKKRLL